jgi:2-polyprenyl-6-methoxyphenol hydroxylase-like FAD-dependent oxidoreductase
VNTAPRDCDVLVAGGGPAGMIAGLLFARAGLKTVVAEKHADFLRDFRGDTVHPSTLEIFHRLGLLEAFLRRPHQKLQQIGVRWRGELLAAADLTHLKVAAPYIAFMPQWEFLDFVADTARENPNFELLMRTEAHGLIEESGAVAGLRLTGPDGPRDIRARLTIAADGRSSVVRAAAGLPLKVLGAPVDVLWFALPRGTAPVQDSLINAAPGTLVVTIDRGSYWQCAFVIDKGGRAGLEAAGLDVLKARVAEAAPHVAAELGALESWDEIKLLSVAVDRLERWSRPGLLAIGDAAHAMSPVGGVGINLAVQDAVAAANLLAPKLKAGELSADDLDLVRRRRLWPTRATQFVQVQIQNRLLAPLIAGKGPAETPPLPMRLAGWFPPLRRALAKAVGLGVRPELPDPSFFG